MNYFKKREKEKYRGKQNTWKNTENNCEARLIILGNI
jgi:hypothetical protein